MHSIDFLLFQHLIGYYQDILFQKMFSYKLFQFILCLLISFLYSQAIKPTFKVIQDHPSLLLTVYNLTIPCNILMLVTFLFELTFYD